MISNGTLHYDHDRDGTHTQLAGCEAKFRNLEHDSYVAIRYEQNKLSGNHACMTYFHKFFNNSFFTVSIDIDNKAAFKPCFEVSGVQLPTQYYRGMSAATGDLSDNHDIIAVKMYELDLANDVSIKLNLSCTQWLSYHTTLNNSLVC